MREMCKPISPMTGGPHERWLPSNDLPLSSPGCRPCSRTLNQLPDGQCRRLVEHVGALYGHPLVTCKARVSEVAKVKYMLTELHRRKGAADLLH
jgi:hypothetical protein